MKYRITIEQVVKEEHEMQLEGVSAMEALDHARAQVAARNKKCPVGTVFSVKKVEEIADE